MSNIPNEQVHFQCLLHKELHPSPYFSLSQILYTHKGYLMRSSVESQRSVKIALFLL